MLLERRQGSVVYLVKQKVADERIQLPYMQRVVVQ
jgi:hypothetical protein